MGLQNLLTNLEDHGTNSGQVTSVLDNYSYHYYSTQEGGFNYGKGFSTTPVFDGVFRQKSFKFGEGTAFDQPGGSFSNQPYLYSGKLSADSLPDIDNPTDNGLLEKVGDFVDSATDGLIRGGLITAAKRSGQDLLRIGKWMFDGPKGPMWLLTQTGLQLSNHKIEEPSKSVFGINLGGNSRIYNPLGINTLTQVLTNAFGVRISRAGLLPLGKNNYTQGGIESGYNVGGSQEEKYEGYVRSRANITDKDTFYGESGGNRLATLYNNLLKPDKGGNNTNNGDVAFLYEFNGGPHSLYGIGKTKIKRYIYSEGAKGHKLTADRYTGDAIPYTRNAGNKIEGANTSNILDFRELYNPLFKNRYAWIPTDESGSAMPPKPHLIRDHNYGLGSPGRAGHVNSKTLPYSTTSKLGIDKLNALNIIKSEEFIPYEFEHKGEKIKDFIPFRFEAVNTDAPEQSDYIMFRAFLDNVSDGYNANWNSFKYNGRGEEFYTYNTFKRKINFSFKVAAQSRDELRPLYQKLNYLVSNTAPGYRGTRMRGNFMRITIGDWISRIPGILNSINLKWNKNYPWEIALERKAQDADILMLPHVLDVSVQFTPVHNFIPQKSATQSPFILPNKRDVPDMTSQQDWAKGTKIDNYDGTTAKSFDSGVTSTSDDSLKQNDEGEYKSDEELKAEYPYPTEQELRNFNGADNSHVNRIVYDPSSDQRDENGFVTRTYYWDTSNSIWKISGTEMDATSIQTGYGVVESNE